MSKKIILAGGTGFVGKYLHQKYDALGYKVITISRQAENIKWTDEQAIINALDGSELIINLAGKSVDCRYNEKNKATILNSRTETTKKLGELIQKCSNPPKLWINSSTATIYRHAEDFPQTESKGEIGSGFSVNVAKEWEQAFFDFQLENTRQVALRMAIVLGKDGGVMTPMVNLTRLGLGGKQGNGKQMFSWIHIDDLYRIIEFVETNENIKGVVNCSSPNPIANSELMRVFRSVLKIPIAIPSPKFLLEIGAVLIRTETELVLKSRWVVPEKLIDLGFSFRFPEIKGAIENILLTNKD